MEFSAKQAMQLIVVLCCAIGVVSASQSMSKDNNDKITDEVDKAWHPGESKNLLDVEYLKQRSSWLGNKSYKHLDIELEANTTYTLSMSKNNMNKNYKEEYVGKFAFFVGENPDTPGNNIQIGNSGNSSINKYTFTTSDKPYYFNLYTVPFNETNLNIVFDELLPNIQLEKGSVVTDYEPYKPPILK